MGFYGNITNVNKTQFTFDTIYPNRLEMDTNCTTDGIFIGRYVLIEYDSGLSLDSYYQAYSKQEIADTANAYYYLYTQMDCELATRITKNDAESLQSKIVFVKSERQFYTYINGDSKGYALFKKVTTEESNYNINYNIDLNQYGSSRGYDSTVWQKVFVEGVEKYISIAELNTVVPEFDVAADAPTMFPVKPHFDTASTNVYYKLHMQPSWGLRIAEASDSTLSDIQTTWYKYTDNDADGTYEKSTQTKNAAVYYNKAGFDVNNTEPYSRFRNTDGTYASNANYISIEPTGKSGNTYEHNFNDGIDIQEIRINLPVIGDMVAEGFDIIHGDNRDNSPKDSLWGKLISINSLPNDQIPVQYKMSDSEYGEFRGLSAYGDAWINPTINASNGRFDIVHTYNPGTDEDFTPDMNGSGDTIDTKIPQIDDNGHVVAWKNYTHTLPYGFKTVKPGAKSTATAEITSNTTAIVADSTQDTLTVTPGNKWIRMAGNNTGDVFTIAHEVHSITSTTKDDTNLDGIGEFTVQDLVFDAAGHVTANQKHKYTLPYNIRNVAITVADTTNVGSNQVGTTQADSYNDTLNLSTQNRWINLSVNDTNDTISIGHAAAGNASASANLSANNNLTPKFGEKFKVLTAGIDQTGHVKNLNDYEIALPQPSLNDLTATGASVLTGLSMVDSTGAITQTNANVGTLKLTGYTTVKANDATYVQASHTINDAFNKVDTRLDVEISRADTAEKALNKRIDDLDVSDTPNLNQVVYKVEQTDGKIAVAHENVGNLTLAGYALPESVNALALNAGNTLNTALGKLEYRLNAEASRATAAENNLSTTIGNETSRATTQEELIRQEFASADATLTNNLNGEIDRAKKAEENLTTNLNNEVKRAQDAEKVLTDNLSKEVERAQGAEKTLTDNLNNEISRAKAEEEKINGRIDAILGGVTEEELNTFKELSDALADDTNFASTVNNSIAGVQTNLNNAIAQEVVDRNNAITEAISQEVINRNSAIEVAINQEVSDRNSAITGIVEEIGKDIDALDEKFADYLTTDAATNTYQTKLTAGVDYVEPATLDNYLTTADASTTYQTIIPEGTYVEPATLEDYVLKSVYDAKIAELTGLIEGLTARIVVLEGYHVTTEDTETGGEDPVPEETT